MDIDNLFTLGSQRASESDEQNSKDNSPRHHEVFQFLSICLALGVPILPLIWRPSLESLGQGATGYVSQSSLNKRDAYAFKRFTPWRGQRGLSKPEFRSQQYNAFISEMTALRYGPLKRHPNVVDLEGMCWEVAKKSSEILPVLIFPKAECTLESFLSFPEGIALSFEDRMTICGEISRALFTIHCCGIVHGDVKPQNALVFRSIKDPNKIQIKIIDFGYSCLGNTDDDLVQLPHSIPWTAPEYHDRAFAFHEAKKTDIYSFGLLCLWVIFLDDVVISDDLVEISVKEAFQAKGSTSQSHLEALKQTDKIRKAVQILINTKPGLAVGAKTKLNELFRCSLQRNPRQREASMEVFVELLSQLDEYGSMVNDPSDTMSPEWHGAFQIETCFHDLEACDYRVHRYIFSQLQSASQTEAISCIECSQNAALQAAICLCFGFGTSRNLDEASKMVERAKSSLEQVQGVIQRLSMAKVSSRVVETLGGRGFQHELGAGYVEDGVAFEAIQEYKSMKTGREAAFGLGHFSTRRVVLILSDILERTFDEESSINLKLELLEITDRDPPSATKASNLATLKNGIARVCMSIGRFDEAEKFLSDVLEACQSGPYKEAPLISALKYSVLFGLAHASFGKKDYQLAVNRGTEAVQQNEAVFGSDHPNTLFAKSILGKAARKAGQRQLASSVMSGLLKDRERVFGALSTDTLDSAEHLACIYVELGQLDDAAATFNQFFEPFFIHNDQFLPQYLRFGRQYSVTLAEVGELGSARQVQERRFTISQDKLGSNDIITVMIASELSMTYVAQQDYEKAKLVAHLVFDYYHNNGIKDKNAIQAIRNYGTVLYSLGEWENAAEKFLEELDMLQTLPDSPDQSKIAAIETTSKCFIKMEKWSEAQKFLDMEIKWKLKHSAPGQDSSIMNATVYIAMSCLKLEKWDDARFWLSKLFEYALERYIIQPSTFIPALERLELQCEMVSWLEEAEQLLTLEVLTRTRMSMALPSEESARFEQRKEHLQQLGLSQGKAAEQMFFNPIPMINRGKQFDRSLLD